MRLQSNSRINKRERGLIRGAIRRVFSRSELRAQALAQAVIPGHTDPKRPRVTKWFKCPVCELMHPAYLAEIDHKDPVVPVGEAEDDMDLDDLINRRWCDDTNLQPLCGTCHDKKSALENKERKRLRDLRKPKKGKKA